MCSASASRPISESGARESVLIKYAMSQTQTPSTLLTFVLPSHSLFYADMDAFVATW
jgi:hypothetical protein